MSNTTFFPRAYYLRPDQFSVDIRRRMPKTQGIQNKFLRLDNFELHDPPLPRVQPILDHDSPRKDTAKTDHHAESLDFAKLAKPGKWHESPTHSYPPFFMSVVIAINSVGHVRTARTNRVDSRNPYSRLTLPRGTQASARVL